MRARRLVSIASFVVLAVSAGACGSAPRADSGASATSATSAHADGVARVHRTKCGACHVRVEPGERTRAELESALARHRPRVRMSEDEWGRMVDYLAAAGGSASRDPAPSIVR
jgi:hypothetical protein